MIKQGDCLEVLKTLPADSVDSLVTDPPAGISFMGKAWDADRGGRKEWIKWLTQVMSEAMRVMKPGAHGLVWAIPRTSHWTATACEDAGFEVREKIYHLFGSGFPKSMNVSIAIDKAAGASRVAIGVNPSSRPNSKKAGMRGFDNRDGAPDESAGVQHLTAPATPDAKKWDGWGTALKPAVEEWVLIRKPLSEKTVAKNVLKWGTGALNIDASRIEGAMGPDQSLGKPRRTDNDKYGKANPTINPQNTQGRFPANLVLSCTDRCTEFQCDIECAIRALDEQSGTLRSGAIKAGQSARTNFSIGGKLGNRKPQPKDLPGDSGGASRFFYCAKASKSDKNAGLEGMPKRIVARSNGNQADAKRGKTVLRSEVGSGYDATVVSENHHPTVKSTKLMTYLIRMVTPPGGLTLDPFAGSGSTGVAAIQAGFKFIGIEREPEYAAIAMKRIEAVA